MLVFEVSSWVIRPEAKVHGINNESIRENLLYSVVIRINVILCPWFKCDTSFSHFIL